LGGKFTSKCSYLYSVQGRSMWHKNIFYFKKLQCTEEKGGTLIQETMALFFTFCFNDSSSKTSLQMQTCVRIKKNMGHRCISGSKSFICLKNYRNFLPPQSDFEKKQARKAQNGSNNLQFW
jgi:hypothetical protein